MLQALKKRLKPTEQSHKQELLDQYRALQRPPKNSSIEDWLQRWESVYTQCKKIDLPDVAKDRATRDFIKAVPKSEFTSIWLIRLQDIDQKPDLYTIVQKYREYHRDIKDINDRKDTRVAYTTFKGVPIASPKESTPSNHPISPKKDNGQVTKPYKPYDPCFCGRNHAYRYCYYLIELIRPNNWKPDPIIQREINEKIKKSPILQEKINRAKQFWAAKSESPKTPSPEASFMAYRSGYSVSESLYPLKDSYILDSGATIHVCNNPSRFINIRPLNGDILITGDSEVSIEGYGTITVYAKSVKGQEDCILTLNNVVYVPTFYTNLILFNKAIKRQIY